MPTNTLTIEESIQLYELMAKATCAHEDFGADHLTTLIIVGQGMFWSQELDERAKALASDVDEAFLLQGQGDER